MRFRESHSWLSDCDRVWIKRERNRYELSTRFYPTGSWFFGGRFNTLAAAKKAGRAQITWLEAGCAEQESNA